MPETASELQHGSGVDTSGWEIFTTYVRTWCMSVEDISKLVVYIDGDNPDQDHGPYRRVMQPLRAAAAELEAGTARTDKRTLLYAGLHNGTPASAKGPRHTALEKRSQAASSRIMRSLHAAVGTGVVSAETAFWALWTGVTPQAYASAAETYLVAAVGRGHALNCAPGGTSLRKLLGAHLGAQGAHLAQREAQARVWPKMRASHPCTAASVSSACGMHHDSFVSRTHCSVELIIACHR
jgi:hypothetical protein